MVTDIRELPESMLFESIGHVGAEAQRQEHSSIGRGSKAGQIQSL